MEHNMENNKESANNSILHERIIRDIPLIERYARNNEDDDYRFRAFLKGRINMSTKKQDEIVRSTTDEIWQQIDCTKCANCCKTLPVVVDNADVKRLAARLKVSQQQFLDQYVTTDAFGDKMFASTPCAFLGEDNLCTVYEDRPKACKDFPYLHNAHFTSRSLMMISNTGTCPIVFNVWRELKTRLGYRRKHRR
jgi:Fe-S-cluster containining protein